jgi:hypothetical protein
VPSSVVAAPLRGEREPDERDGEDDGECHQDQCGALARFAPQPADPLPGGIGDIGSLGAAHALPLPGIDRDHALGSRLVDNPFDLSRSATPQARPTPRPDKVDATPKKNSGDPSLDVFDGG